TSISSDVPTHGNYHNYQGCYDLAATTPVYPSCPILADTRVLNVGRNQGQVSCKIGASSLLVLSRVTLSGTTMRLFMICHPPPILNENSRLSRLKLTAVDPDYFPASCRHMFSHLPIPPTDTFYLDGSKHKFPHNTTLRRAD
ncbi:hypothetical protein BJY52DRAFT_1374019, partial [Lactarius psammicola]